MIASSTRNEEVAIFVTLNDSSKEIYIYIYIWCHHWMKNWSGTPKSFDTKTSPHRWLIIYKGTSSSLQWETDDLPPYPCHWIYRPIVRVTQRHPPSAPSKATASPSGVCETMFRLRLIKPSDLSSVCKKYKHQNKQLIYQTQNEEETTGNWPGLTKKSSKKDRGKRCGAISKSKKNT